VGSEPPGRFLAAVSEAMIPCRGTVEAAHAVATGLMMRSDESGERSGGAGRVERGLGATRYLVAIRRSLESPALYVVGRMKE